MLALGARSAVVDGEVVVARDFLALRAAPARPDGRGGVFLCGFDLIELDGRDLRVMES